jgi:hypothetical protein
MLRPLRKRCAHCEKCFTPRRNETPTFATPLYNRAGRVSRIIRFHYHFPEIKSSELEVCSKNFSCTIVLIQRTYNKNANLLEAKSAFYLW